MSDEQLKAFLEAVKADTCLQEKLKAAGNADAVLIVAQEAGYTISVDIVKRFQSEVSNEELEEMTGGLYAEYMWKPRTNVGWLGNICTPF
jgi:predicted ribosomally synthesized peptide with nif11-like leader